VYFVSSELLTGIEANIFGEEAVKGQPNLYLAEGGAFTFIGRLGSEEALAYIDLNNERKRPSAPDSLQPVQRTSRVSSDGRHLAFTTTRPLSGYDNTDQTSGQPDTELFLYDADPGAGPGTLACVSCNPTQARPTGRKVGKFPAAEAFSWAAALLPGWSEQLKPSRLLSADGNRLYFESFDALTPRDQNGMQDVYQWERATSAAQCEEAGAELFSAEAGGCLSLISTGEDEEDSELIDASVGAKDVFFATEASLLPQDPALVDLYDAREGGGFPVEVSPIDCEGEACQPRSPAPLLPGNSSEVRGQPNAKPASTKCPKGKHKVTKKGKARCVKNKKAKKQKRANKSGRATR
jgi:hypothetical protein